MAPRTAIVQAATIAASKTLDLRASSYVAPFAEDEVTREARLYRDGEPRHVRCFIHRFYSTTVNAQAQIVYFNNKYRVGLARFLPDAGHFGLLYTANLRTHDLAHYADQGFQPSPVEHVHSIEWAGTAPGAGRTRQRPHDYQLGRGLDFAELDPAFAAMVRRAYRELWQLTPEPGPSIFTRVAAAVPKRMP